MTDAAEKIIGYIILAEACQSCGGRRAIKYSSTKPSDDDIKEVRHKLGGMFCIETEIITLTQDEEGCNNIFITEANYE